MIRSSIFLLIIVIIILPIISSAISGSLFSFSFSPLGVLIGNKNDLRDVEEVTEKEGDEMAKQMVGQFSHVRTSALDGYNVDTAFNTIASHFLTLFENTAQKYKEAL